MDERQVSMYGRFTWRILSNHVTPWEFEQLKNEITDYEQWCAAWSQHAARHVERIAAEYGGPVTTVIHPDGVHIVNNLWYQARPLVADWLAGTL
jgi:tryptophan 2,3-dioxygenase